MEFICPIGKHLSANFAATMESVMSEDDVVGVSVATKVRQRGGAL